MNRLFLKVFIGFWLTTLVALIAGQQLAHYLNREAPRVHELRERYDDARRFLRQASRRYQQQSPDAWQAWLRAQQTDYDWLVHRPALGDIEHGLAWDDHLAARIERRDPRKMRKPLRGKGGAILVRPLFGEDKRMDGYMLVRVKHPHPLIVELFYKYLWLRLLLALIATGAISYWMVRRYTRPVRELREATQALAEGNLTVRLTHDTGKDDLSALRRDFNLMARQLEAAQSRQRTLIHDVSHELRTPLARIQAALALANRRRGESAELDRIAEECDYLNQLIDQLLQEPARHEPTQRHGGIERPAATTARQESTGGGYPQPGTGTERR